jgi:hypothetical protein
MNDEQMAILRMVGEGKLTAEEADRLLQALEPAPRAQPASPWAYAAPDEADDETVFQRAFDTESLKRTVAPGTTLNVRSQNGSIYLFPVEGDTLRIEGASRRHYRLEAQDDEITIRASRMGASFRVGIPRTVRRVKAMTEVGEVEARDMSCDELHLRAEVGNIRLNTSSTPLREGQRVRLRTNVGEIRMVIAPQSACDIQAATGQMGQIVSRLSMEVTEEAPGMVRGKLNGGGADVRAVTEIGNITIRPGEIEQDKGRNPVHHMNRRFEQ